MLVISEVLVIQNITITIITIRGSSGIFHGVTMPIMMCQHSLLSSMIVLVKM